VLYDIEYPRNYAAEAHLADINAVLEASIKVNGAMAR
jgi:hypothetical protein